MLSLLPLSRIRTSLRPSTSVLSPSYIHANRRAIRPYSSTPRPPSPPSTSSTSTSTPSPTPAFPAPSSRLARSYPALVRLSARTGVPLPSLGISFLILHELTAIIPVVLLFWLFQSIGLGVGLLGWIKGAADVDEDGAPHGRPSADGSAEGQLVSWRSWVRGWYEEAENKVERVGRRYGILGYERHNPPPTTVGSSDTSGESLSSSTGGDTPTQGAITARRTRSSTSTAAESVANAISAYVVVKALLPVRLAASVGLAPAFARFALNPVHRIYRRFRQSKAG